MADLTVQDKNPRARDTGGWEFYHKTGTSADATTAIAIVPAVANSVAVLDELILSSDAAEIFDLMAGSDVLMQNIHTEATKQVDALPGNKRIRSDTTNEAIGLQAATAGNIYYTCWYHYEPVGDVTY